MYHRNRLKPDPRNPLWLAAAGALGGGNSDYVTLPVTPMARWVASDVVTDGSGNVETITDITGNGYDVTQTVSASRAGLTTLGTNARAALLLDGIDDGYVLSSFTNSSTTHTLVTVCNPQINTGADKRAAFLDSQSGRLLILYTTSTEGQMGWFDGAYDNISAASAGVQILSYILNGASSKIRRNGTTVGTGNFTPLAMGGQLTLFKGILTGGANIKGIVAEQILFSGALSDLQVASIEAALNSWYGVY